MTYNLEPILILFHSLEISIECTLSSPLLKNVIIAMKTWKSFINNTSHQTQLDGRIKCMYHILLHIFTLISFSQILEELRDPIWRPPRTSLWPWKDPSGIAGSWHPRHSRGLKRPLRQIHPGGFAPIHLSRAFERHLSSTSGRRHLAQCPWSPHSPTYILTTSINLRMESHRMEFNSTPAKSWTEWHCKLFWNWSTTSTYNKVTTIL